MNSCTVPILYWKGKNDSCIGAVAMPVIKAMMLTVMMLYCEAAKPIAVVTGPPSHHVQSASDVKHHISSMFSSHLTSVATPPHTQPVRLTAAHNAVLLGAYGLAPPHTAPTGLPVTLHPVLQAVDTRQMADRSVIIWLK